MEMSEEINKLSNDEVEARVLAGDITDAAIVQEVFFEMVDRCVDLDAHDKMIWIIKHHQCPAMIHQWVADYEMDRNILCDGDGDGDSQGPVGEPHWRHEIASEMAECASDAGVLGTLACHPCVIVRKAVTQNSNTSPDVLVRCLADDDEDVREAALTNPNLPDEYRHLAKIAQ